MTDKPDLAAARALCDNFTKLEAAIKEQKARATGAETLYEAVREWENLDSLRREAVPALHSHAAALRERDEMRAEIAERTRDHEDLWKRLGECERERDEARRMLAEARRELEKGSRQQEHSTTARSVTMTNDEMNAIADKIATLAKGACDAKRPSQDIYDLVFVNVKAAVANAELTGKLEATAPSATVTHQD